MFLSTLPAKPRTRARRPKTSSMPVSVARWFLNHTELSPRDARRIKALNAKVHDETITAAEERELDAILDLCLQVDTLRAQAVAVMAKARSKRR